MTIGKNMFLKLTANGPTEQRILDYLISNASTMLVEKINAGTKTLAGALNYAKTQARELADGNCVCVDDDTVFGWVIHFFEEDSVAEKAEPKRHVRTPAGVKNKPEPVKEVKPAKATTGPIFLELFSSAEMSGVSK